MNLRHPTLDDFHRMAVEGYESIPAEMRRWTEGVVIRIADWPDHEVLRELGFESPYDLLGLYHGIAIGQKSHSDVAPGVDMIFLYREPILAYRAETGEDIEAIVRNTLIHEIGHHFGLSDEEMELLESEDDRGEVGRTG
jgi:predicted Zn-dependent protease with MMP-like domain